MHGERLTVGTGSGMGGFNATVSLDDGSGEANWHGPPGTDWVQHYRTHHRQVEFVISQDNLEVLRKLAAEMRARGPYRYRDQFAQAGVGFSLDGPDGVIKWSYDIDGGLPLEADVPCEVVSRAVWGAVRAQRSAEDAEGPLLPALHDDGQLMPLHREAEPWIRATRRVARLHRLGDGEWERAGDGSQIVMLGETNVLKFYVPHWSPIVDDEENVLHLLRHEELGVDIPRVVARGELDGWQYLAINRIEGTPLRDVELPPEDALVVARDLGRTIRALHEIRVPKDSPLRNIVPKWRPFLTANRNGRREHELERGTSAPWVDRLVDHLRSWRYRKRPTNVLLHADLTDEHIMLRQVDGRWQLSGIIDFGDVKVGDPAYDFAAPFAFWTADRPELRRAMLDGYGAGEELLDRIFESLLLHQYGALAALELDGSHSIEDIRRRYIELDR